jgi:hypothetical protein
MFGGKTFAALIALELFLISVCLCSVFFEVVTTLAQLVTSQINTLEDSRCICVVPSHVQLVKIMVFEVLATQKARVQNG